MPVVAGALEMGQRLCPLAPGLLSQPENALDTWVVEVLGGQLNGLKHGVGLTALDHGITMIDQYRGARSMITRGQQMPQRVRLRSTVDGLVGRGHMQCHPLGRGWRRLVFEIVAQRTHERPRAMRTAALHEALTAQFSKSARRIGHPGSDLMTELSHGPDLADDRQPAQQLLNPPGCGADHLFGKVLMEALAGM